jgi:membrane peptidoglycan carboxypeptidase
VYGVEGASRDLFGKSVKDVSLSEAALLAGLRKAPSWYSPRP